MKEKLQTKNIHLPKKSTIDFILNFSKSIQSVQSKSFNFIFSKN